MRRIGLFGATVLLPCALLVVFGSRMVRQESELALRHAQDQEREHSLRAQRERLDSLERLKRSTVEQFFAGRKVPVEFAGLIVNNELRLPDAASNVCERLEYTDGRLPEAIACYRNGPSTPQNRLLLGRALAKSGNAAEAHRENLRLLETPFSIVDNEGVPYAWYAADRLAGAHAATVLSRFRKEDPVSAAQSSTAAYLFKTIAERLGDSGLQERAAAVSEFASHLEALRADLQGLLPFLRREQPDPAWLPHGAWLVSLARAPESGKELIVAVDAARVPSTVRSAVRPLPSRTGFYIASLGLVLMIVASGAYLLWRDVRRDLAMSSLRSQFVASVTHELKTPLTSIRMFAETLRLHPLSPPETRKEYLDIIVHESERLSRLVDNVLDFSKIEQGARTYHLQPVSVTGLIESVVRTVGYPLSQAGFELRVDATPDLPQVSADPDALQQAILNLLTNAMKYSQDRKQIDLAARRDPAGVVIAVRDYGIGIPAEHRKKIFERFYRVPSPENRRVPGTGVGLTLVAHIAKAHGGEVTVDSEPGAGCMFSIRLPVEQGA